MSCHSPEEEEDSGKMVVVELVVVVVVVVWMQESMELGSFTLLYFSQPAVVVLIQAVIVGKS